MSLFFFLLMHVDNYNALMCPYSLFEERLGMSQATIARNIKYLKEKNLISVEKKGTNQYIVSSLVAWTSKGTQLKYCKFPNMEPSVVTPAESAKLRKKGKYMRISVMEPGAPACPE